MAIRQIASRLICGWRKRLAQKLTIQKGLRVIQLADIFTYLYVVDLAVLDLIIGEAIRIRNERQANTLQESGRTGAFSGVPEEPDGCE